MQHIFSSPWAGWFSLDTYHMLFWATTLLKLAFWQKKADKNIKELLPVFLILGSLIRFQNLIKNFEPLIHLIWV